MKELLKEIKNLGMTKDVHKKTQQQRHVTEAQ